MSLQVPKGLSIDVEALEALPEAERAVVRDQLRQVEEAFKQNPLLGYVPHEKQVGFHRPNPEESGRRWPNLRAFFGGNRSGKTTAGVVDTILQCVDWELVPEHLRAFKRWDPPFFGRVVTPDLTSTQDGVIHQKIRDWCPPSQLKGNSFDKAFDKVQRVLRFKNGSWIQFNSSEQDREKLGGVALHRVLYDEEPRQEVRNECRVRLIDFGGEELFCLTPFSGMQWLYDKVYEPWESGQLDEDRTRVIVVDMDDNPHINEEAKVEALEDYTGPEREARKSGRFVSFSGLIYPMWEKAVVPQIVRVPPGAEVFRGVDPGIRIMCAVVYCYLTPEDDLVVFDEIAAKDKTIATVCDEMRMRDMRWGYERDDGVVLPLRPQWTVIDPASKNRANQTGRSDQQEFADNGIVCIPGQNDKTAGINRVRERLEAGRLHVTANCSVLLWELKRYRWVKNDGRTEHDAKEEPVKKDDHLLDALRYVVMQRPLVPPERLHRPDEPWEKRAIQEHLDRLSSLSRQWGHDSGPGIWR